MPSEVPKPDPNWPYSGVRLTIHNVIIPLDRLFPTPSSYDNLDDETEMDLRILGCQLIQDAGILLKAPQVAMATGQVLYQRFFYSKSFVKHFYEHYAMACIFLAAKIEECPRRIRDVINVFHHIRLMREQKPIIPLLLDQNYINLKNQVIKAERRVLKELGFCVHGKHPHKLIICYLQALEQERNVKLVQIAWNYMNDSLRTDVFVRYYPETIACACIFLSARQLNIPLPNSPPWWNMFNVDEGSIRAISLQLLRLYARPKPNLQVLESKLSDLRKAQAQAKTTGRGLQSNSAINSAGSGSGGGAAKSNSSPGSGKNEDIGVHRGSRSPSVIKPNAMILKEANKSSIQGDSKSQLVNSTNGSHNTHHRSKDHHSNKRDSKNMNSRASRSRSRTPKAYKRGHSRSRSRSRERARVQSKSRQDLHRKKPNSRHSRHDKRTVRRPPSPASSSQSRSSSSSSDNHQSRRRRPLTGAAVRRNKSRSRSPVASKDKKLSNKSYTRSRGYSNSRRARSKELSKR